MYGRDLAFVHDSGFSGFARQVAPAVHATLRRSHIAAGTVVEAGCGSGVLARYLARAGYDVRGFDASAAMIRLARGNAPRAKFRVASLETAILPRSQAVVCLGEVVTYLPRGFPSLRAFCKRVHRALPPGGVLLFDFLHSARGRTYRHKTTSGKGWRVVARAEFDARTGRVIREIATVRTVRGRSRQSRETHVIHVYQRQAIVSMLKRIGFHVRIGRSIGGVRLIRGDTVVVARRL